MYLREWTISNMISKLRSDDWSDNDYSYTNSVVALSTCCTEIFTVEEDNIFDGSTCMSTAVNFNFKIESLGSTFFLVASFRPLEKK
jgi:hypothetical protein